CQRVQGGRYRRRKGALEERGKLPCPCRYYPQPAVADWWCDLCGPPPGSLPEDQQEVVSCGNALHLLRAGSSGSPDRGGELRYRGAQNQVADGEIGSVRSR